MANDEAAWELQHLKDCKAQLDQGRDVLAAAGVTLFDSDPIAHGIEIMLEQRAALLAALAEIEAHHVEQNRRKSREESHSTTLRIARAAIAKARGEQFTQSSVLGPQS